MTAFKASLTACRAVAALLVACALLAIATTVVNAGGFEPFISRQLTIANWSRAAAADAVNRQFTVGSTIPRTLLQLQVDPNQACLDPAVKVETAATPSATQLRSFQSCIDPHPVAATGSPRAASYIATGNSSINSKTEVKVIYQKQEAGYATLHSVNAQLRGLKSKPLAFAQPTSTEEVAAVVKCAAAAELRFAARNGGHHYEANSLLAGGVVIDMTALQDLTLDAEAQTLDLGAGQKLGPVYAALMQHGITFPGGLCAGVGVSGTTLGGGLGHATRTLGVLADSVLGATVVLANGTVVVASDRSHPDLFWAIRGGGPLYGIITAWKFRVSKAPRKVSLVRYGFKQGCTGAHWGNMLTAWQTWRPWELTAEHAMVDFQCGYNRSFVQIYYWGPLKDALRTTTASLVFQLPGGYPLAKMEYSYPEFVVKEMTNLKNSKDWSLNDLLHPSTAQDQGSFVAGSVLSFNNMSDTAIMAMAAAMGQAQEHAFIQGRAMGGVVKAVNSSYNAFPWREALTEFQVYSNSGTARDRSWVNNLLSTMHAMLGTDAQFYNYLQCCNKNPWEAYFGKNAVRLRAIKQAYDPANRFGGLYCQADVV